VVEFFCLEFSKINNEYLDFVYKNYSKLIPIIGEYIVGDKRPYEYLIKSINEFVNQEELLYLMKKNKFEKCEYINFNGGVVALHTAWKV
jgi:Methylase involved in ubiquinone/menaquinone biosynthesis